jgi:hypothetical protein
VAPLISENKDKLGLLNIIYRANKTVANPNVRINYPEAEVFKNLSYNLIHGLQQPVDFKALESVVWFKEEDPYLMSGIESEVLRFLRDDIYKYTGITLNEYLRLPIRTAEIIRDMVLVRMDEKAKEIDKVKEQLGDGLPKELSGIINPGFEYF